MLYYGYDEFLKDMKTIKTKLADKNIDGIIFAIRGGATMAHFLAEAMNIKSVYALNVHSYDGQTKLGTPIISNLPTLPSSHKTVAIVDEIVDSGETMALILDKLKHTYPDINFVTATTFQKKTAVMQADIFAKYCDEWVEFFWEKDLLA